MVGILLYLMVFMDDVVSGKCLKKDMLLKLCLEKEFVKYVSPGRGIGEGDIQAGRK